MRTLSSRVLASVSVLKPVTRDSAPRAEGRFKACFDAAVDAIIVIDASGRIEDFNGAAERMFGFAAAEVLDRNVSMLMPEPHCRRHDQYLAHYLATGEAKIIGTGREVTGRRKDATLFPARLSVGETRTGDTVHFVGIIHDLTAQKAMESELLRERDRAESYLDLAEVMLLALDQQARIVLINRKGCEILGYAPGELIGRDWFETCVPQSQLAEVRAVYDTLMTDGDIPPVRYHENAVVTRTGERRLIAWRNRITRDESGRVVGTLSSGEDITEQRAAEDALKRSEATLRTAQEIANIGNYEIYVPPLDADLLGPQVLRILGISEREGASRGVFLQSVHPDDRERFERALRRVLETGGEFDLEYRIRRPGGEIRIVHATAQVFPGEGRSRLVGTLHDVTQRRLAEEEALHARQRLTHVSRLSTMGEMAAGLAHEINQPLTAITAYAQACQRLLQREDAVPTELVPALEQISAQALRAGQVISRLRNMVKGHDAQRETVDCNGLVEDLVTLAEPDARAAGLELRLELADTLPLVHVDVIQIHQVLLNLVRNAIDATTSTNRPPRDIVIRTRAAEGDDIEIAVIDHGAGLPADAELRLFQPFFTTKRSGTGLGLSISQSIIRAHGGQLRFARNPDAGATFSFNLPGVSGEKP